MSLTLVLGPANSAKAGLVFDAYRAAAPRGAVLVVPTGRDAELYARELAADGALLGSVVTFSGLAGEIARRAGARFRPLSELARRHVLRRAAKAVPLVLLAASAESAGFASALGELIAELGRSMVTPQRFAQALEAWARQHPGREAYARELASLPLAYARELERLGRPDAELAARRSLDTLRADPARWGRDAVFFYGFDDLTALERDAIETLAFAVEAEVMVSLTYEPDRDALSARAEVVESLRPLARRVVDLPALEEHYAPAARRPLHHLERRLFRPGQGVIPAGDAVRLLEAGGRRAEVELIAAEVLALRRSGVRASEIALVARRPGMLVPVVERVFGDYGLAISAERRLPFPHTVLGRAVRALARCAWSPEAGAGDLLELLRAPGLLEQPELADRLEARLRRGSVRSLARARAVSGLELGEIDGLARAGDPAAELVRHARRLQALPHRGEAALLEAAEREDAAALAALVRAVEELTELGEPLGPAELLDLLEELEVRQPAAEDPGAVLLADPLSIRARRFRHVFVCGLQEGAFPSPGTPEPFLPDDARWELAQASGVALRLTEDVLARERHLFYATVSRATERVTLSYCSSDEEGNLALASPFLRDVSDLFEPDLVEGRRRRLLADVVWRPDQAPTERERVRARAVHGSEGLSAVDAGPRHRLGEAALALARHTRVVSPGALEAFAECPVKWLVERELSPARLDPDPEPMVRGSYVHMVLEEVLRRLGAPLSPVTLGDAVRILAEVMADSPAPVAPAASEAVRQALTLAIEADLRRYLEHEAATGPGWRPQELELRFGFEEEGTLPALELEDGEVKALVRGTIDRVDVDESGRRAIVRDYKSGSARPQQQGGRWSRDGRVQAPLYMVAVHRLLGLDPVAGLYQPLAGKDLRPRGVFRDDAGLEDGLVRGDMRSAEALEADLQDAVARSLALIRRLRAGELEPCPATCSRDGCRYPSICRAS